MSWILQLHPNSKTHLKRNKESNTMFEDTLKQRRMDGEEEDCEQDE